MGDLLCWRYFSFHEEAFSPRPFLFVLTLQTSSTSSFIFLNFFLIIVNIQYIKLRCDTQWFNIYILRSDYHNKSGNRLLSYIVIMILLTIFSMLYITQFPIYKMRLLHHQLQTLYLSLISYTWKCIGTLKILHCAFYVACVHHTPFHLFVFHLVLKESMRSDAVMPFGDNSAQTKAFKQMIMFCFRSHVLKKPGCITVMIFCAL